MKTKRTTWQKLMWMLLLLPSLFILNEQASASHFRYGHLTWQRLSTTGNNVRFTLTCAFRRNDYPGTGPNGSVAVGEIFSENIGQTGINYGDGGVTGTLQFKVISIDPIENWCLAQALEPGSTTKTTLDHTYSASTNGGLPWVAEINSCCRTLSEVNNPDGCYRVSTLVETASGNRSPISSLPAIVNLPQTTAATFVVPAADADPNTILRFRLALPIEGGTGNNRPDFSQPVGLSIDSITGLVTWNTLANAVLGSLYSCQVIIEDKNAITGVIRTRVAVDFLIYIIPVNAPCNANTAPVFAAPTPGCGSIINVNEGQPVSFTINATDADAGNVVTLNSGGGPAGSTFTPGLPANGNPVSSVFNWTPAIGTAGSYVVSYSATDSCGAQALCSATIQVNPIAVLCSLRVTITHTKTSCAGVCDGTLTANPTLGTAPYLYLWSNGQTTKTVVNLCKGLYTVTVTDANGCTKKVSCTVTSPLPIKIVTVLTQVKCKGSCTGSIVLTASAGIAPYTYLWSNGSTTKDLSLLCAGPYTVTVTDFKGCTAVASRIITEPAKAVTVSVTKVNSTSCNPCNGSVQANPGNGVGPYTYVWSNGATTRKITGLCAGTYTAIVTDKNGCTGSCFGTITGINCCPTITINALVAPNTNCGSICNGSITAAASFGVDPHTYLWSSGETTASITDKCAGSYTVTAANLQGCSATATFNILDDIDYEEIGLSSYPPTCMGTCTGSASVSNTNAQYYQWSNGESTASIDSLCAGTFTVNATFNNGCTQTQSFTLNDPSLLTSLCTVLHDESQNGANDGVITADGFGGTGNYSYVWSNGSVTKVNSGLSAGTYTVTVSDAAGCAANPSTCNVIVIPTRLGSGLSDTKQITTAPNPFSQSLKLNIVSDEDLTVTVKDAVGRTMSQFNNVQGSLEIRNKWQNGIYFITIQNSVGSYRKVLKVVRVD